MGPETLTALIVALVPFVTELIKRFGDKVIGKLPVAVRIIMPIMIGAILQTLGNSAVGNLDPATATGLGAAAGGLASSIRDIIHRT